MLVVKTNQEQQISSTDLVNAIALPDKDTDVQAYDDMLLSREHIVLIMYQSAKHLVK